MLFMILVSLNRFRHAGQKFVVTALYTRPISTPLFVLAQFCGYFVYY